MANLITFDVNQELYKEDLLIISYVKFLLINSSFLFVVLFIYLIRKLHKKANLHKN